MLNFFIYIFWWDKPRNVECPIRVYKTSTASHEKWNPRWSGNWAERWIKIISSYTIGLQDDYVVLSEQHSIPMFWSGRMDIDHLAPATLGPAILGSAFGAIHCIAWSSAFSSRDELVLWRISCIAMITIPFIVASLCACIVAIEEMDRRDIERTKKTPRMETREKNPKMTRKKKGPSRRRKLRKAVIEICIISILFLLMMASFLLYIVSRIATLVIAFTSLRSLPPGALMTVEWTTFIPHVGSS
ncbi:hypothetical protein M408DRAFT_334251 [Serendipita vermifera MAFF 305830]|uniref:Uncharacterized protein n=1 Tax=Serendipita vermifera MAFF 305830 TaxID=933852 RepID=A0A0C3AI91_SERVB|nr:hypothetical protein M408DRAFT_334251 [Serendipita vermifera MAFF 305830]